MFKKTRSFLRAVFLFPFCLMMGIGIDGGDASADEGNSEQVVNPELAAAIARGDIIEESSAESVNPDGAPKFGGDGGPSGAVDDKPAVDVNGSIPMPRFQEVIEQNRALKAQLEAMKSGKGEQQTDAAGQQAEQPAQNQTANLKATLKELRQQQRDALVESDMETYDALTEKIDELMLDMARQTVKLETEASRTADTLHEVATKAYEKYPFLDVNSPLADPDAINAVVIYRNELVGTGIPVEEALKLAVENKGPKFALLQGTATNNENSNNGQTAEQIRDARNRAALEKSASASINQPSALPNKSEKDGFAIDVNNMTPAQIKALPEETKARLRGDVL